ncbi:Mterf2 [Columba guinea]|nr:Mterf2 [Columba guinea]
MVLELTTQIVQYRIKKLSALGYDIKSGTLESLNGTKKDFEANYDLVNACSCKEFLLLVDFYSGIHIPDLFVSKEKEGSRCEKSKLWGEHWALKSGEVFSWHMEGIKGTFESRGGQTVSQTLDLAF